MAIALKEYCGDNNIATVDPNKSDAHFSLRESAPSDILAPDPNTLMVEVEGIHSYPFRTKNCTRYMVEALKRSQKKWTTPYLKPLIKHHNDQNGDIIGRIYDATYTEKTAVENTGGLLFTISIPEEKAAKDVKNRILETVSIGVSANDVRCSICGAQITDASEGCPNGHDRGSLYENEVCCWDIYDFEPKELSYVIVPSDVYAKNKRVYLASEANSQSIVNNITEAADDTIQVKETNGDQKKDMDLDRQLLDAQERIKWLEDETKRLQCELDKAHEDAKDIEELRALKATKEEQDKKLADIQATLDERNNELEEAKKKLVISEEKITVISNEKEAAEKAGFEAQESLRELASRTLNQYRKIKNRAELAEEELKKRSIDSILDSICDIAEEFSVEGKTVQIQEKVEQKEEKTHETQPELDIEESTVPNPVAPKNEAPKKTEPKDDYRQVDLSEGLSEMFSEAAKLN